MPLWHLDNATHGELRENIGSLSRKFEEGNGAGPHVHKEHPDTQIELKD